MEVHEPIKRDRNLNITVIADDSRVGRVAVDHGVMLAEVFQASLTVMANFGFGFGLPESRHIPDESGYLKEIRDMVSGPAEGGECPAGLAGLVRSRRFACEIHQEKYL